MGCIRSKNKNREDHAREKINDIYKITKRMDRQLMKSILDCKQFKDHVWGFENLVVEGSGANITVLAGAYKILESVGILSNINQIIGSSTGSIIAAFTSVRMPSSTVERLIISFSMSKKNNIFDDDLKDISRLINKYGRNNGCVLERFVENALYDETGISMITFKQVLEKYNTLLYITRTNLTRLKTEYLSVENTPNMPISAAVRYSSSIPIIFDAPVTVSGDVITDGSVGIPYPLDYFDNILGYNEKTLGLKILNPNTERHNAVIKQEIGCKIEGLSSFIESLTTLQKNMIERLQFKAGYWERTITLEAPRRPISELNISMRNKIREIHQGAIGTVIALTKKIDYGTF